MQPAIIFLYLYAFCATLSISFYSMRVYPFLRNGFKLQDPGPVAIYVCSVKHMAKGSGTSAAGHAEYIGREGKYAGLGERGALAKSDYLTREGRHSKRSDLEAVFHENMPIWAKENPREFWQAADTYERKNGRVYTEILVALPRELSPEEREKLVRQFAAEQLGDRFPYTASIHNPAAMDGREQPHAHVMFSNRERDGIERPRELFFRRANSEQPELGGAKKSREWSFDSRSNDMLGCIRETWERSANAALERAGVGERIDRRSNAERGLDAEPEPKMGPVVTQRVKQGLETEKGAKVIELRDYRREKKELEQLEEELKREKAKVYQFDPTRRHAQENEFRFFEEPKPPTEEERQRYRRTVDLVLTRYKREDGTTEFRWNKTGKVAFVDRGDRITFSSITPTAVKAGLQVAKEKGWQAVEVKGSEDFRREAWIQAGLMGIELKGYRATKEDQDKLEQLRKEQEQKKESYRSREGPAAREKEADPEITFRERAAGQDRTGDLWVKASDLTKDIDRQIKQLRQQGGRDAEKKIDELYRDKYDLKQLGDAQVKAQRTKDGSLEPADRAEVKRQAQQKERSKQPERGRDRGR